MSTLPYPPGVTRPTPVHALTRGAELGRAAVLEHGRRRREGAAIDRRTLVTKHAPPYLGDVTTAGARRLEHLARDAGMRVNTIETLDACVVEAIDTTRGVAFRAIWERGRAKSGTWHEQVERWEVVDDKLTCLASPRGLSVGVTAIVTRVKALAE